MARLRYLQNKRSGVPGTISKSTNRIYFNTDNMYLGAWDDSMLDLVSSGGELWLEADDILLVGNVHIWGDFEHDTGPTTEGFMITVTDPTPTGVNAIYGLIDAGAVWTSGNMVGVRGNVDVNGTYNYVSATGVWAGLDFAAATGSGSGLTCALNAEVSSDNATVPNAIVYIQSLPGSSANFSDVPYIVFSETKGGALGTGSRYLFEVGHKAARTIPTIGSDELFYNDTLQIAVNKTAGNRTNYFIPLSTTTGTFTFAYPIDVTVAGGTAIDIGTSAIGIDFTGTYTTGIDIDGAATGIDISVAGTANIAISGANTTGIAMTGTYSAHGIAIGVSGGALDLVVYDDRLLSIWSSSDATGGNVMPVYIDATCTDSTGVALPRALEAKLTVSGKMGDYGNAIKGYTDLTGGTGCAGLVSAICAEMKMPAGTALGTHAVLEIELVMPSSAVIQQGIGANCTSFIRARVSDTAVQSFNDYGYLLDLQGLTSAGNDLWDGCTLKCAIGSTKMYLLLSTATASFTTAYPIHPNNTAIGINFVDCALVVTGRDTAYISMGNYSSHITLDLSSVGSGDRFYGIQMYLDSVADTAAGTWFYAIRPEITVNTENQLNTNFSGLVPTFNIERNVASIRCIMAQLEIGHANLTAITYGCSAVSGYVNLGTETKTLTVDGTCGIAAVIGDIENGKNLTLGGAATRVFAVIGNIYTNASATGALLGRVDGSGILAHGILVLENSVGATAPYGISFHAGDWGHWILNSHSHSTAAEEIVVEVMGNTRYIRTYKT